MVSGPSTGGMLQAVICFLVRDGQEIDPLRVGAGLVPAQEGGHKGTPVRDGGQEGGHEGTPVRDGGQEGGHEGTPVQDGGREGRPGQILLGYKKVGFGKNKYGGAGGKREPGETLAGAAVRELEEETGICVCEADLLPMAHLIFLFPFRPTWSQEVVAFVARRWKGEAAESREIVPVWFDVDAIPYAEMWDDCRHWLPHVLAGQPVHARFVYAADNQTVSDARVEPWTARRVDKDHFIPEE